MTKRRTSSSVVANVVRGYGRTRVGRRGRKDGVLLRNRSLQLRPSAFRYPSPCRAYRD